MGGARKHSEFFLSRYSGTINKKIARIAFLSLQKIHRARPKAERIEGGAKRGAPPTFAYEIEFEFFDKGRPKSDKI